MNLFTWLALSRDMLVFTVPFVLAGTCNMIFTKSRLFDRLKVPIDRGKTLNGKRLFGQNKTWKGFIGMIVFSCLWLGLLDSILNLYFAAESSWLFGACLGFGYVLMELPNSFVKRQWDIDPGQSRPGGIGILFQLIDQLDSVAGCAIVIVFFLDVDLIEIGTFLVVGTLVHLVVHWLLLLARLKNYHSTTAHLQ